MEIEEAETLLADAEVVPCLEGGLVEVRELRRACLEAGVPALVTGKACDKPGCTPKAELLIREEDLARVKDLMNDRWRALVESVGGELPALVAPEGEGEPPCPACGAIGPLKEGACGDCGLQLE